ncbi:MAG: VOC family protein [Acidobacteria bacterium]|nr:VOC family protein [Acidobacteriota bacterium]MBI3658832.1 VOC family protein [Acidobacteriota bacterium]
MATGISHFGLTKIEQISVTVHDLEKAVVFYRDYLGLRFLFRGPHMAFFDCGGIRVMLAVPESAKFDHPSSIVYYKVDDIDFAFKTLSARGVIFHGKPHLIAKLPDHELWMAFFEDVDENTMALMCEVRSQ